MSKSDWQDKTERVSPLESIAGHFVLILAVFGVVWLLTLPYHSTLAIVVATTTMTSAPTSAST